MLLEAQMALVTGAGRGNGEAIACGLARAGASVIVTDINQEAAEHVASKIRKEGGAAYAFRMDVTDTEQCASVSNSVAKLGQLSILVNNAGVRPRHAFDCTDRDLAWYQAMDVNLHGLRNVTFANLSALRSSKGSVINVTSIAAFQASPGSVAYSTSKAAAQMFSKVMALELAPMGVRVNAIAPGVIETDMTSVSRQDPDRRERLMARIPMGRFGQPEDLVGPVVFLASNMANYVTGAVIAVDGGYLAV